MVMISQWRWRLVMIVMDSNGDAIDLVLDVGSRVAWHRNDSA